MKKGATFFLRSVVFLMGGVVLGLCMFLLPAGLRTDVTGLYAPIIIGLYVSAVPFFIALYQTMRLLKYIDEGTAFSELSVSALKRIKYCGVAISALYSSGMPYLFYAGDKDDAPGVVALGLVIIFASLVVAVFAAVLQKLLQNAIDIKSENDLTV